MLWTDYEIWFWPNPRTIGEDTAVLCSHAEAIGYDGVWLADHFLPDEDELIAVHELDNACP